MLLHGVLGSEQDWVNQTRILIRKRKISSDYASGKIIYVDQPWNYTNYGEFIGWSSRNLTSHVPISGKREDLGIAGFWWVDKRALRNGIKYPTPLVIGAFSSDWETGTSTWGDSRSTVLLLEAVFKDEETFRRRSVVSVVQQWSMDASHFMAFGRLLGRQSHALWKEQGVSLTYKEYW